MKIFANNTYLCMFAVLQLMMDFCEKVHMLVKGQLSDAPELRMHYFLRQTFAEFAQDIDDWSPSKLDYNRINLNSISRTVVLG